MDMSFEDLSTENRVEADSAARPSEPVEKQELFRFSDPRQERIDKRLSIVGSGPAEFFYDACRLMATQPQFKSTTHLVSHLIREIESSVRAVVEPLRSDIENGG